MAGPIRLGIVTAFDEARGLGTVTEDPEDPEDAGAVVCSWPFHCTQIADGTRDIEVGSPVAFRVAAGHLGRTEAIDVVKLGTRGLR